MQQQLPICITAVEGQVLATLGHAHAFLHVLMQQRLCSDIKSSPVGSDNTR